MITIKDGTNYISQVRKLIIEYTKSLNRDLTFQNIEEELKNPAVKYTAPEGELLVAVDETDHVIGMVAYHRHNAERCEMKRLYVKPQERGMHLGELLVKEIIEHAKQSGYKEMVLDTIVPLKAAIGLYKKNGFKECEPYYNNPMADVIYMIKTL
jgi:ribosomal protein S18 acetylase RimI-like enzyme